MFVRTFAYAVWAWLTYRPEEWVDLERLSNNQIRDAVKDRRKDDHFSKKYIRQVQRRIAAPKYCPPKRPLIEVRPKLIRLAKAAKQKKEAA